MKTILRISTLLFAAGFLCSCGATAKPVQYVYVDAPRVDPHPTRTTLVDNSDYYSSSSSTSTPTRTTSVVNDYSGSASSSSSTSKTTVTGGQSNRCWALADQAVAGAFRGYGQGRSTNITAAQSIAFRTAQTQALSRITTMVDMIEDINIESIDESGKSTFIQKIKSHVSGVVNNSKVVCSELVEGKVNEVHYCVQISAEDVINLLKPDLSSLSSRDQDKVISIINGEYE